MPCGVVRLCTRLSWGMTDAYVPHCSVQWTFTSPDARRSTLCCKVAWSRRPHSQSSNGPVS
jgi:hypothetical protein